MQFFPLSAKRPFYFTVFSAVLVCFLACLPVNAQNQNQTELQTAGAIDPLRFDFSRQPKDLNSLQNKLFSNQTARENEAPTAGELDTSFDVSMDFQPGEIRSSAKQADGKLIIGGFFRTLNESRYKSLARLNTDNSLDSSFSAETNGTVFTIAVQTDGKILIGGSFTVVNGTDQNRIARLNADGSLDSTFNASGGADKNINNIILQPDGKILVGGNFNFISNGLKFYVARLNADGSIDNSFTSGIPPSQSSFFSSTVSRISLQSDGKILAGGMILLDPLDPTTRMPIVRLNSDGSIDNSFINIIENAIINDIAVLSDDKILISGNFQNVGEKPAYLLRLNSDGTLDTSFDATASGSELISDIYIKDDGKILAGSLISTQNNLVKQLSANGLLEISFTLDSLFVGGVNTINLTSSGKIFVGGNIRHSSGVTPNTALLFNPDGSQDASFILNSTALGGVRAMLVQSDGKILVGGNFNRVNGAARNKLVRLNPDGTIDESFPTTGISALQITTLVEQPDGKILIGGFGVGTTSFISSSIVRINSDGSADASFDSGDLSIGTIKAIALQSDGKILVSYSNNSILRDFGGGNIIRLNSDGSIDKSFNSYIDFPFEAISVLPNGQILVGGPTGLIIVGRENGQNNSYYGVFRLNADGTLDLTFRTGFESQGSRFTYVYDLILQTDGKILVGGRMFAVGSTVPAGVARLEANGAIDQTFQLNQISSSTELARVEDIEVLPNGKLLAGGRFNNLGASSSVNITRLNDNGTIDNSLSANTDSTIYDVELQTDGNILIGGDFENVNGTARTSIARLLSEPLLPRRARFDFDGDNRTDISIFRPAAGEWWYLRSSDGSNRAFGFGSQTDKITPADFTGDGLADIAFWRESSGEWFILRSEDSSFYSFPFGTAGDIPVPEDFDGDGFADAAVFRPSNATWYILNSSGGTTISGFGVFEDIPMPEDYDGDGKADLAVFRPSVSEWWMSTSTGGNLSFQFGASGDKPLSADFTGDGKSDVAVWREGSGEWFVLRSEDSSYYSVPFGLAGDIPAAGDYDGDGIADVAVFRPSSNVWYLQQSTNGFSAVTFGAAGDKPVPSAFVP